METKKTEKANLENKKGLFQMTGLVLALLMVLYAFKTGTTVQSAKTFDKRQSETVPEEIIPITSSDDQKPVVAPPPPMIVEIFREVEDGSIIDEDIIFAPTGADDPVIIDAIPWIKAEKEPEDSVFRIVEKMPVFPGGDKGLLFWLNRNINYPEIAIQNGDQGIVYVSFVVGKDGKVSNAQVVRKGSPSLDEEALRVVSDMPSWEPGKQRGIPVRVSYTVPIRFQLK